MAPFRLRIVVLLWLVKCFFESGAEATTPYSPWTAGEQFVFSLFPKTGGKIYMDTKAGGKIGYFMECSRNCEEDFVSPVGNFEFPNFEVINIEFSDTKERDVSGKQLRVFVLMASAPISAMLIIYYPYPRSSIQRVAGTFLAPASAASKIYYYLTRDQFGTMLILSLNYTTTDVGIYLKDNIEFEKRPPKVEKQADDHSVSGMRRQYEPRFIYDDSLTGAEGLEMVNVWHKISLEAYGSLYLKSVKADLTGSKIEADNPITLLQGAGEQGHLNEHANPDVFLDSAAPYETIGTYYIVAFCGDIGEEGEIKIVSAYDSNKISVEAMYIMKVELEKASDWITFYGHVAPTIIESQFPVIVQKTSSTKLSVSKDGPCLTTIPPVAAWMTIYKWSNVNVTGTSDLTLNFRLQLMVKSLEGSEDSVKLNGAPLETEWLTFSPWNVIDVYSYACVALEDKEYEIYIDGSPGVAFYAHLLSYNCDQKPCMSYCLVPGPTYPRLNAPPENCRASETLPGDLLDNDCDGRFDEEAQDGKDDDEDGRIDEDLESQGKVDGVWGEWAAGECVVPCGVKVGESHSERRRCDNPRPSFFGYPCIGDDKKSSDESVKCVPPYLKCESECLAKEWGYNCTRKCPGCFTECDKKRGTCDACTDGLTTVFCNETCPENCLVCDMETRKCKQCATGLHGDTCGEKCAKSTYGPNCAKKCGAGCRNRECDITTGKCFKCADGKWGDDCSRDCLDGCVTCSTRNGKCAPSYVIWYVFFISLFVIAFGLLCFCYLKYQRHDTDSHSHRK